ncbi:MAG: hypothetical protein Q9190_000986 [Brigantiaea leucoxantha]
MAKKSKLLLALDAKKGIDHGKERQKKLQKEAAKKKRAKAAQNSLDDLQKESNGDEVDEENEDTQESDENSQPITIPRDGMNMLLMNSTD